MKKKNILADKRVYNDRKKPKTPLRFFNAEVIKWQVSQYKCTENYYLLQFKS